MRSAPNFPPIMMRTRDSPASCFLLRALLVVIIIIVIVGQVVLVLVCVAYLPPSIRNQPLSQSSRP